MRSGVRLACAVAALLAGVLPPLASAKAECANSSLDSYPGAAAAAAAWEQAHDAALTATARAHLAAEVCAAVASVARQSGYTEQALDTGSTRAVSRYLDASLGGGTSTDSLTTMLAKYYVLHANPMSPEPIGIVLINLHYSKAVDSLLVGGEPMAKVPSLLAETGSVSISGIKNSQTVCSATVQAQAPGPRQFNC